MHWCPAHVRVAPNELVDRLAKDALDLPQPDAVSLAAARQHVAAKAVLDWQRLVATPKYRGNHSLIPTDVAPLCTGGKASHPLFDEGCRHPKTFARFSRFVTGHFPHGDYRARFRLEGPTACHCGAASETRDHILFECPLWLRPALLRGRPAGPDPPAPPDLKTVLMFLKLNPILASFEWTELLAKVKAESERGIRRSYARAVVRAHTWGKLAWLRRECDQGVWKDDHLLLAAASSWNAEREAKAWCLQNGIQTDDGHH